MIIALAGQKGGSGKSTTATALAAELLGRGARVLLVDGDPQGSARTWAAAAVEGGHPAPTVVAMGEQMHEPSQLPQLAPSYTHVLIDCPPSNGPIQRAALMSCDVAVLPCGQSAFDAWSLGSTITLAREAQGLRPRLVAVVLLTRTQPRTVLGKSAREVLEPNGLPVLRSELTSRVVYQEAAALGLGPATYAPHDQAAAEVRALADELLALAPAAAAKKGKKPRGRKES